jgi:anti-sigma factor RsiW
MINSTHTDRLFHDYVLGLLPVEERRHVEAHVRDCSACRAALQREKAAADLLRVAVRNAVHRAAQPAPGRLAALRPPLPAVRPRRPALYLRLAPVMLLLAFLALGMLFGPGRGSFAPGLFAPQTATAAGPSAAEATATANGPTGTATSTHTPSATLAQTGGAQLYTLETAQPPRGRIIYPARTIAPSATPIVAVSP